MKKNKKERIKLNGRLKSSLRKNSPEITYSNIMSSGYIQTNEKYTPKLLIIQIILNSIILAIALYFEILIFIVIFAINYIITWIYSLFSVLKNKFKRKNNKLLWITLILFVPFSAFVYPDFKRIQVVNYK